MLRITPLILAFLFTCTLAAETVAGIDLDTLKRPEGLELTSGQERIERRVQSEIKKALAMIKDGERLAATKDEFSKLKNETIDRSQVRKQGEQKIEEGEAILTTSAASLKALYGASEGDGAVIRTWTSTEGRTLEASFVQLVGNIIKMKSYSGQEINVPLERLSESDQALAKLLATGVQLNDESFLEAVETKRSSEVNKFLEARYEPSDSAQAEALIFAVEEDASSILKLLLDSGFYPNAQNSDGLSALSVAAKEGEVKAANSLLKAGASPTLNDSTEDQFSPIHWALKGGDSMMVLLLTKKANEVSDNIAGLLSLAEEGSLKPIKTSTLKRMQSIDSGESVSPQEVMDFKVELFGLQPNIADLEKAINNRGYRSAVLAFHSYGFYTQTLQSNNEYMDVLIDSWKKLETEGNTAASYSLALSELHGWSGELPDNTKAINYLQRGAEEDHAPSLILLGQIYEDGIHAEADSEKAFNYYRLAAEIGDAIGMVKLGHCYEVGLNVDKDTRKAFTWYQRAADTGSTEGIAELGRSYMEGIGTEKDAREGLNLYTKAADANNLSAMRYLGDAYLSGKGGRRNTTQGIDWLQRAADFGDRSALLRLGQAYSDGTVRVDDKRASTYFLKAAENQDLEGMYQIGQRLFDGIGIDKDKEAAFSWYKLATSRGHLNATNRLGVCYSTGEGVTQDLEKAFELFKRAAEKDHMEATANLAVCYAKGLGTEVNDQESTRLYLKVANSGNAAAKDIVKVLGQE